MVNLLSAELDEGGTAYIQTSTFGRERIWFAATVLRLTESGNRHSGFKDGIGALVVHEEQGTKHGEYGLQQHQRRMRRAPAAELNLP
jgi:hypothetical protein